MNEFMTDAVISSSNEFHSAVEGAQNATVMWAWTPKDKSEKPKQVKNGRGGRVLIY